MTLTVNGETRTYDGPPNLAALLEALAFPPTGIAVARNEAFVPRSQYVTTPLTDGDRIEVVSPMQGG